MSKGLLAAILLLSLVGIEIQQIACHQHHELPEGLEDIPHHECVHDEFVKTVKLNTFEQEESPIEATQAHEKKLRREHKGNWQNIRILADFSNLDASSPYASFVQTKLVPSTTGFVSQAYQVYPKTIINEVQGQQKCGDYTIPKKHQRMGISGYDLVLYIGVENANGENWLARAAPCYLDKTTLRPVAGMVQFNGFYLSKLNLNDPSDTHWFSWVQTTIHECTHVLGFSSSMFRYYINPNTNKPLQVSQVVKSAYNRNWIVTPPVVSQAQSYFACQQAWGVPLENNGGGGTAGSHWERTTFGNEAMTGSDFPGAVFSVFTFKLMESTGWYLPNYKAAQPYVWGSGEGCPIEQGACPTSGTLEFCGSQTQDLCSTDWMGTAHCANDDPLAGGCSYWEEYGNMDCRQHGRNVDYIAKYTGGYVGSGSRCWQTSLPTSVGFSGVYTGCYKSQCQSGTIVVTVGTSTYTCQQSGQVINVKFNGRSGKFTCPDITRFCAYESACPGDCSGRGTCNDTVCSCWAGFTGQDCSQQA